MLKVKLIEESKIYEELNKINKEETEKIINNAEVFIKLNGENLDIL